ncbi:DUF4880 domain-containing protein [Hyphomicrobium sp. xq]|uniref:DUF4880 domain-containing protein n=1 Tax=Hyphomicrobium album TaxID=2665159 RepID=A0A6I3KFY9_9HYPH|nr:FecR domain-containing protein [Hyphomicrobium album]MTD92737.1 DUF4880 domain-containing protein [Hyphomicrobium album]
MSNDRQRRGPREHDARSWVVLLASGRVTAGDAAAFREWQARDPNNAKAFAQARLHWDLLGEATGELARLPADARAGRSGESGHTRRWLLGAGLASAAATGVALINPPFGMWSPIVDFAADFRTGIGERRTIAIGGNASVELTTRSRLALDTGHLDSLRMDLLAGEAAFAAGARLLTVIAGAGQTSALNGRFSVRNDSGTVAVTCLSGALEVRCRDRALRLRADQQVRYDDEGLGEVKDVDPNDVTAWQRGLLVFRNKPLQDVVDEVNRYRPGKIVILDRDLGSRLVALASFYLDRLDDVIPQIETLYGAQVRRLPAGIVLLS